ncbi:MAG: hypothetical protein DUD39_18315, partial [Coriobacteriaceae bacterium]
FSFLVNLAASKSASACLQARSVSSLRMPCLRMMPASKHICLFFFLGLSLQREVHVLASKNIAAPGSQMHQCFFFRADAFLPHPSVPPASSGLFVAGACLRRIMKANQ